MIKYSLQYKDMFSISKFWFKYVGNIDSGSWGGFFCKITVYKIHYV